MFMGFSRGRYPTVWFASPNYFAQIALRTFGPILTLRAETDFVFLGSKTIEDDDCSHEIHRHFLLARNTMTNQDRVLKSRVHTLLTKVLIVKAMVFPVVI